jgi:hypothetical protein
MREGCQLDTEIDLKLASAAMTTDGGQPGSFAFSYWHGEFLILASMIRFVLHNSSIVARWRRGPFALALFL